MIIYFDHVAEIQRPSGQYYFINGPSNRKNIDANSTKSFDNSHSFNWERHGCSIVHDVKVCLDDQVWGLSTLNEIRSFFLLIVT